MVAGYGLVYALSFRRSVPFMYFELGVGVRGRKICIGMLAQRTPQSIEGIISTGCMLVDMFVRAGMGHSLVVELR